MNYSQGQSYLEYISNNAGKIRIFNQQPYSWKNYANGNELDIILQAKSDYKEFAEIEPFIAKKLTRDIVADYYKEYIYKGVIATILWGGGHMGPYNSFIKILSCGKTNIENRIKAVKDLIEVNNLECAFNSMLLGGSNHIDGISVSYFTKILYFLTYDAENTPRPLIFDNIAKMIHYAILKDEIDNKVNEWYEIKTGKNNVKYLVLLKTEYDAYYDYITRMNNLARENGINRSDKLEAALFGEPTRRGHQSFDNPRYVVKKYIGL